MRWNPGAVKPAASLWVSGLLLLTLLAPAAAGGERVRVGGTGSATRPIEVLAQAFHKKAGPNLVELVPSLGSRGGKKALLAGALDIAFVAEVPMPGEQGGRLIAREIARTPLVFATAKGNPVSCMTLQQVIDAYQGAMTTWPDGERLRLILRPEKDTDTLLLRSISPDMERAVDAAHARPGEIMAATDQDAAQALESTPGAFGMTTLALIVAEQRPLKALSIDGVPPTPQTIADGTYPYFKPLYIATRGTPSPAAQRFLDFIWSKPGRKILARLGYWVP